MIPIVTRLYALAVPGTSDLLVIDGDTIYALEAGGEKDVFEKDIPYVLKAFATLD